MAPTNLRRIARRAAAVLAFTALLLLPSSFSGSPDRAVAAEATRLPHVAINQTTLANGLRVLLLENHDAPVATVEVWYHVGSKDEQPGQTGFAHLFEHLMFDGTTNLAPDEFSDYIVRSGGLDNAYTTEDATVFWETVPAADLPVALWLEADRMRNLQITDRVFKNEREVVEEERRQRFDNQPYGTVVETLYAHAFTVHPYQHVPIGSMQDLDRASVAEVKGFYDTYYWPNNATLVIVGDFDSGAGKRLVEEYFASVPAGPPVVRHIPVEPPQKAPRTLKLTEDVSLPAFIEGFHMPADGAPDAYPLRLAAKILSEGSSSRIYRRLVYDKPIALQAESEGNFTEDPNLFFVFAVLNQGHTPAEAEREVDSVLEDLKSRPVSRSELEKARNEILRDLVLNRQSDQSRADELGYDSVVLKDADLINTEFARFLAVTPEEIGRVAKKYFVPENMTRVEVYPGVTGQAPASSDSGSRGSGASERKSAGGAPLRRSGSGREGAFRPRWSSDFAAGNASFAPGFPRPRVPRDRPPEVPSPQPIALPAPTVRVLPNGLTVLVVERHSLPVVTLRLEIKAGAEADPPGLPGVAQFVASILDEGTEHRSAPQIADAIDGVGGELDAGADRDGSFGAVTVLADHTALAFDLLSDMIRHPAFAPADVERVRRETLSALDVLRDDPSSVADNVFEKVLFAGTPYSHPPDGTVESVRRLTPADLRTFHNRWYRPENCILAISGDVTPQSGFAAAAKYFGDWKNPSVPAAQPPFAPASSAGQKSGREIVMIDKPDAVQTEIRIGNSAIARSNPDYDALTIANQILGGPASNRLFGALRSQRGLAYGASSDLVCYRSLGAWEAKTSTRTAETEKAVHLVLDQMKRLRDHAISAEELDMAADYLVGHQALDFETADDEAGEFLDLAAYGLPLDRWASFPQRLRALTPDDVLTVTRRYLDPDRATIVLVGNASAFTGEIKKLGAIRVIPLGELDLSSSGLRARGSLPSK